MPYADEGFVDVTVSAPDAADATLVEGMEYFNPANKKAGVDGGLIDRIINASIFDSSTGDPLPGAHVIVGHLAPDQRICVTDDRGQCVISEHGLRGTYTITAAKKDYSAYTIAEFGGENVTIYIRPQDPPVPQGPPSPPGVLNVNINELTGEIQGTLHGLGKYVLPPPPSCDIAGSPDGEQCTKCSETQACPGELSCQTINDTGSWCLKPCSSSDDCATGFTCAALGDDGLVCVPHGGELRAECGTGRRNFCGSNPDPGQGRFVDAEGKFEITSRMGEVTVYCIAGYTHPVTAVFVPTYMGIAPTVVVGLDQTIEEVDVYLTIPLNRTLRARVFDLPQHPDGVLDVTWLHAVDIGAEGWIPMNQTPTYTDGEMVYFAGYPESATVFHEDAAFTFYDTVRAASTGVAPQSYRLAYRLESVAGEPIRARVDGVWEEVATGMGGDLHAIWGAAADDVWGVGPNGRLVHRGSLGWTAQPNFTDVDLNALHGLSPHQIVAVGEDGLILEFDGSTWVHAAMAPKVGWDLKAVHASGWAVGDGGVLRRQGLGWTPQNVLHSTGLRGVTMASERVVAVGEGGKVLIHEDGEWSTEIVVPGVDLNAVAYDGQVVIAVGDEGLIIARADGDDAWTIESVPTTRHLWAVTVDENGTAYAAGTAGTVLMRQGGEWLDETQDGQVRLEVKGLWAGDGEVLGAGLSAVPVGPWMAFPDPINPRWYEFYGHGSVDWTMFEGGPDPTYNTAYMSSSDGFTVWVIVAAGHLTRVDLPDLGTIIDYDPIPIGQKFFNVTRALNPTFSMEAYKFSELSMWRRTTWSSAYGTFY